MRRRTGRIGQKPGGGTCGGWNDQVRVATQRGGRIGEDLLRQLLRLVLNLRPPTDVAVDLRVVASEDAFARVGHTHDFAPGLQT
jgi:hypothetical protein